MARCYRGSLRETIDSGHGVVARLDAASREDPALGGAHALVRGLQVDVANGYGATREALEELGSGLDAEGGSATTKR